MSKKKTRKVAIVLACILIPVGAFGFGYFFSDKVETKSVSHTLKVDGEIIGAVGKDEEDVECDTTGIVPGDAVKVPISIRPTSSADSLLRVKVEPYWMSSNGGKNSFANKNLELIMDNITAEPNEDSWYEEDGYHYYIARVNSKTEAISLVKGLKFSVLSEESYDVNKYQDMRIGIKVSMEMVQCSGDAYSVKWNSSDNMSETLKDKLNYYSTESKTLLTN